MSPCLICNNVVGYEFYKLQRFETRLGVYNVKEVAECICLICANKILKQPKEPGWMEFELAELYSIARRIAVDAFDYPYSLEDITLIQHATPVQAINYLENLINRFKYIGSK